MRAAAVRLGTAGDEIRLARAVEIGMISSLCAAFLDPLFRLFHVFQLFHLFQTLCAEFWNRLAAQPKNFSNQARTSAGDSSAR